MYLETAGVDGNLTYFFQTSFLFFCKQFLFCRSEAYRHSSALDGFDYFSDTGRFDLARRRDFRSFQTGQSLAVRSAFCDWFVLPHLFFTSYRPIGLGEDFDLAVSLLDDIAFAFFVPLFLHFCLRYPVRSEVFDESRWKTYPLYVPAAVISTGIVSLSLIPQFFPKSVPD